MGEVKTRFNLTIESDMELNDKGQFISGPMSMDMGASNTPASRVIGRVLMSDPRKNSDVVVGLLNKALAAHVVDVVSQGLIDKDAMIEHCIKSLRHNVDLAQNVEREVLPFPKTDT